MIFSLWLMIFVPVFLLWDYEDIFLYLIDALSPLTFISKTYLEQNFICVLLIRLNFIFYMDIQFLYSLVKTSSFLHCSARSSLSSIKWTYMCRSALGLSSVRLVYLSIFCAKFYAVIYSKIFICFFCSYFSSENCVFIQFRNTFIPCNIVIITVTWQFLIIPAEVIMGLACVDFLSSWELVIFSWFFPCQVLLYCILRIMNILLWHSVF